MDGGDYGTGGFNHNANSSKQNFTDPQSPNQGGPVPQHCFSSSYQGQKRPYSAAFNKPATPLLRPQASPAVPSFGGDILLPPASPSNRLPAPKKKPRKHNQLGLTPASQDHESSSDENEEVKLANRIASRRPSSSALLQIEYKGRTATLQTAADIAAWITERKKNFPSTAKAEAAKSEADEKRRKWEKSKKEGAEAQRLQRSQREKARQEELRKRALDSVGSKKAKEEEESKNAARKKKGEDGVSKVELKTERLRRKLEKAQRDARKAEEALARMQHGNGLIKKDRPEEARSSELRPKRAGVETLATPPSKTHEQQPKPSTEMAELKAELLKDEDIDAAHSSASGAPPDISLSDLDDSDINTADEATSSSGSSSPSESEIDSPSDSDSDSDSAPEEITSKRTAPDRVPPPPRIDPSKSTHSLDDSKPARTRNLCRNLLRTGRCQFGHRCRYSHELSEERKVQDQGQKQGHDKRTAKTKTGRKGLYQVMVEKEVEEEGRAVLRVIMAMGEKGMLEGVGTRAEMGQQQGGEGYLG